ncbi:hypothetical protein HY932_01360 [Candidatus Falkowbacteria bacterium]|nr:hypothetical protein [Candidatus Falkowbacteria bacterium]
MINLLPEELRKGDLPAKMSPEEIKLRQINNGNGKKIERPFVVAPRETYKELPQQKTKVVGSSGGFKKFFSGLFGRRAKLTMDLLKVENVEIYKKDFFVLLSQIAKVVFVFALLYGIIFSAAKFYNLQVLDNQIAVNKQLAMVQQEIKQYESSQSDFVKISKRFAAVKSLLDKHVYWGKFFNYLESYTLPAVDYNDLVAEDNGKITLSAVADDYTQMALQLKVFQGANDFVKKVEINSGSLTGTKPGQVGFQVNLELADQFLNEIGS